MRIRVDRPAPHRGRRGRARESCGREHTQSGARGNFDRDYADAVVKSDPTKFRLVLPSQYRTTD